MYFEPSRYQWHFRVHKKFTISHSFWIA